MTAGALLWLIIFGACGALFFGIGVVVTIRGFGELREILKPPENDKADV